MSVAAALTLGCLASRLVLRTCQTGGAADPRIGFVLLAFEEEMERMRTTTGSENDDAYIYAMVSRLEAKLEQAERK